MSKKQYLFTVTHFDGDADRVATPLVLANNALAAGGATSFLRARAGKGGGSGMFEGLKQCFSSQ